MTGRIFLHKLLASKLTQVRQSYSCRSVCCPWLHGWALVSVQEKEELSFWWKLNFCVAGQVVNNIIWSTKLWAMKTVGRSVLLAVLSFLTPHLTVLLYYLSLASPCRRELRCAACYPKSCLHHAGSVQVVKQKASFCCCCCFYHAIAMSFIRPLLFPWGIISGNLDRILWLALEKGNKILGTQNASLLFSPNIFSHFEMCFSVLICFII